VLPCSAARCQERIVIHAAGTLHTDTLREQAQAANWRHDAAGDWCPWHSPEQEASARSGYSGSAG